jgi:nicotinate-nucleotide adenylyltransferase
VTPSRYGDRRRLRIGILGGSFNPAHAGHLHIARAALARLRLNEVWLLVSPGNPLKDGRDMAPLAVRLASARAIADGRRVIATDIERHFHRRTTQNTLTKLHMLFPCAQFVWLMGADNLVQLPRWNRWMDIARHTVFAVLPRPTYNHAALAAQAAHRLRPWRMRTRSAIALAAMMPPAWVFLDVRQHQASATAIRQAADPGRKTIARKPTTPAPPGTKPPAKRAVKAPPVLAGVAKPIGSLRKKAATAGPRGKREKPATSEKLDGLQALIVTSLEDDKAEGVLAIDLAGRAAFADRMVIATGLADRQISAMATHLEKKLREAGIKRVQIEGLGGSDWVLIDAGDIVVHLFKPDARVLYGLERMWGSEFDEPAVQTV